MFSLTNQKLSFYCTILIMSSLMLMLFAQMFSVLEKFYVGYLYFLLAFCSVLLVAINQKKFSLIQIGALLLLYGSMVISFLYNHNRTIAQLLFYLQIIAITYTLWNVRLFKGIAEKVFLFYIILIPAYMLFGADKNNIFHSVSRNNISIWLVTLMVLAYLSMYQNGSKITIYYAALALAVAMWAGGRSGVISVAVCFLILSVEYLRQIILTREADGKNKKSLLILLLVFVFIATLFGVILMNIIKSRETTIFNEFKYKFSLSLFGDVRFKVLEEYAVFASKNWKDLLFGVHLLNVDSIRALEGNPHNMFINLHSSFGLMPTIFIIVFTFRAIYTFIKSNRVYLAMLICLLVRGFSDVAGFPGQFDFLILFILYSADNTSFLRYDRVLDIEKKMIAKEDIVSNGTQSTTFSSLDQNNATEISKTTTIEVRKQ